MVVFLQVAAVALEGTRIEAVDPGGRIWERIGPERAIGCVVYPAAEVEEPGVVRHVEGVRFPLGEPSGERTERVEAIAKALVAAGLKAPVRADIRSDIWVKLWGNLSFNPISALTGGTLVEIVEDPGTRAMARAMMVEAQAIGEKLGVKFPVDVDRRIAGAGGVGAAQDLDAAGPRARPADGDRRPRHRGSGARAPRRHPDAGDRHRSSPSSATWRSAAAATRKPD